MGSEELYTSGAYLEKVPDWHVEESAGKAWQILRLLKRNRLEPRTIADVGCGAGEVLRQLQMALSTQTYFVGFDISARAIELALTRANERITFTLGDIQQDTAAHFDVLLVLDVVEHVEDYFAFLRALKDKSDYKIFFFPLELSAQSVLRPRGLLHTHDAYGHLHYFTRETALQSLADAGYQVVDEFYSPDALERPTHLVGRKLLKLPRKLLYSLHQDFAVHLLGGYRLLVLAR
jgi:SAM-dependent methyltransferase